MNPAPVWLQHYAPLHGIGLSAAVAALPIATLLLLLAFGRVRAHVAALAGLAVALAVAIAVFGMPTRMAMAAAAYGAAFGLFPIGWIVLNAVFVFDLSVATGGFDALGRQIAALSGDRRIQVLLIAFGFGAFIEGAAGFGAPVAITSALLVGLGFTGLDASRLALIGNTAPVAFGAVGIPVITLAKVTGLDLGALTATVGRQLPVFSFIIPFWLVAALDGRRGLREVWPACLTMGVVFAAVQFAVSNFHGPWLVDMASSFSSIAALIVLLQFWRPGGAHGPHALSRRQRTEPKRIGAMRSTLVAWLPWIFLTVFVFAWSLPSVRNGLDGLYSPHVHVPGLHLRVARTPPLAPVPTPEPADFVFNLGSATGTALLLAGLAAAAALRVSPRRLAGIYLGTLLRLRAPLATIAAMLALGFTTRYAGADAAMGLALVSTGILFPFFSPIIGWLGSALTGSDTSSNVLFGNVQQVAASRLGLSPVTMAAANSSGGVMGKMIDAQSIVVASAATGGEKEGAAGAGAILRRVFWHSLALVILVGLYVLAQTRL